jgi:hypothetical protein
MASDITRTNAAHRIFEVLGRVDAYSSKDNAPPTTLLMWGNTLEHPLAPIKFGVGTNEHEDAVIALVSEFRRQVRFVEVSQAHRPDYKALVSPLVQSAYRIASSDLFHQEWPAVKRTWFKPELASAWGWLARSLPPSDEALSEEQFKELVAAVAEVEKAAAENEVPEALRSFVAHQTATLRAGVRSFLIAGPEPLREALATGYGEIIRDHGVLAEAARESPEQTKRVLRALVKAWKLVADFFGDVDNYRKGAELASQTTAWLLGHSDSVVKYLTLISGAE